MADEPVILEIDARGVATVTLNRPDVNNAYDDEMIAALLNGVKSLSVDDRVRLVVLRGAGKHFQAGANLKWLKRVAGEGPEKNLQASRDTEAVVRLLDTCPKPTVAVVPPADPAAADRRHGLAQRAPLRPDRRTFFRRAGQYHGAGP